MPVLMSGVRRFGRYGSFRPFGHLSSGHASVGSMSIGKISLDCQFLFRQSQWGVLGDGQFPAGIVYLNLSLGPPQGCRVKSATVTITLDEEDPCLAEYQADRRLHKSGCPVQMTDWYGPKQLAGPQESTHVKWTTKMAPEVHAMGVGIGGMGAQKEASFKKSAQWTFNGQLLAGKNTWTYKTLRWDIRENELTAQSFHSNKIYTAFTFEHAGQPFLMKVEMEGKLEKWNDRLKSKIKFGSSDKKDGRITTLVDFGDYKRFQKRLDEVARGLPRAMEMKNFEEIPVEVPNSIPGITFKNAPSQET
ncbi:hypothetical protein GQ53DRAFT_861301, partial [Thozetella sp. PMI_491]